MSTDDPELIWGDDEADEPIKSVRVHIKGRVQGVFFRAWTMQEATKRGLAGWVRNLRNGQVEALFSGPATQVDDMFEACKRGPEMARVASITYHADPPPEHTDFKKLPTV